MYTSLYRCILLCMMQTARICAIVVSYAAYYNDVSNSCLRYNDVYNLYINTFCILGSSFIALCQC